MKSVQVEELSKDAFEPYGSYTDMLNPAGPCLGEGNIRFYRDMKESQEYRSIPIIIITGISADFEEFISTRRQVPPPEGFLSKPIDQQEFVGLVAELLS